MADAWWEREKWSADLVPYVVIIRAFLDDRLTGPEFEVLYYALFKSDEKHRPHEIFRILDGLFADIDDYVYDPELRQRAGGIDDQELRRRVRAAQTRLAVAVPAHPAQ